MFYNLERFMSINIWRYLDLCVRKIKYFIIAIIIIIIINIQSFFISSKDPNKKMHKKCKITCLELIIFILNNINFIIYIYVFMPYIAMYVCASYAYIYIYMHPHTSMRAHTHIHKHLHTILIKFNIILTLIWEINKIFSD